MRIIGRSEEELKKEREEIILDRERARMLRKIKDSIREEKRYIVDINNPENKTEIKYYSLIIPKDPDHRYVVMDDPYLLNIRRDKKDYLAWPYEWARFVRAEEFLPDLFLDDITKYYNHMMKFYDIARLHRFEASKKKKEGKIAVVRYPESITGFVTIPKPEWDKEKYGEPPEKTKIFAYLLAYYAIDQNIKDYKGRSTLSDSYFYDYPGMVLYVDKKGNAITHHDISYVEEDFRKLPKTPMFNNCRNYTQLLTTKDSLKKRQQDSFIREAIKEIRDSSWVDNHSDRWKIDRDWIPSGIKEYSWDDVFYLFDHFYAKENKLIKYEKELYRRSDDFCDKEKEIDAEYQKRRLEFVEKYHDELVEKIKSSGWEIFIPFLGKFEIIRVFYDELVEMIKASEWEVFIPGLTKYRSENISKDREFTKDIFRDVILKRLDEDFPLSTRKLPKKERKAILERLYCLEDFCYQINTRTMIEEDFIRCFNARHSELDRFYNYKRQKKKHTRKALREAKKQEKLEDKAKQKNLLTDKEKAERKAKRNKRRKTMFIVFVILLILAYVGSRYYYLDMSKLSAYYQMIVGVIKHFISIVLTYCEKIVGDIKHLIGDYSF